MRRYLTIIAVLAASAVLAPSAGAQNLVTNGDFEQCSLGGSPASWFPNDNATTLVCDPDTPHSGSWSMEMHGAVTVPVGSNAVGGGRALSDCITTGLSSGNYTLSFWFRTADTDVSGVSAQVNYYSSACAGFGGGNSVSVGVDLNSNPNLRDNQWHLVSGTVSGLPPLADSARVLLAAECSLCVEGSGVTTESDFDDVSLTAATAVTLRSFAARRSTSGVLVEWRTASEVAALGFNVYREVHGRRVKANARLIRAKGPGRYAFVDRRAPRAGTLRYWIQAVNVDGSRRWYGPKRVA